MGELVCEAPAPSMPLRFWNDPGNLGYREAYFEYYRPKGKNVWRHGDYVMIHSKTGGLTFYGRSDAVIKVSGVRVGTSEIYNVVEKMPEIADSLAVGQNLGEDQRIILFVKMAPGQRLSEDLKEKIKKALRKEASPKHVPALILEIPDIPDLGEAISFCIFIASNTIRDCPSSTLESTDVFNEAILPAIGEPTRAGPSMIAESPVLLDDASSSSVTVSGLPFTSTE